jgi:hypothetical protein
LQESKSTRAAGAMVALLVRVVQVGSIHRYASIFLSNDLGNHFIALVLESDIFIRHTNTDTRPQFLMAPCQQLSEEFYTTTGYTHNRASAHSLRERVTQWPRTVRQPFASSELD